MHEGLIGVVVENHTTDADFIVIKRVTWLTLIAQNRAIATAIRWISGLGREEAGRNTAPPT